jgi:hypothetical protein
MFRYARKLANRGANVLWRCPSSLFRLFRASAPEGVTIISDGDRIPEHDLLVPCMSLAGYLDGGAPPLARPYLKIYQDDATAAAVRPASRYLRVGIAWAAGANNSPNLRRRSLPMEYLGDLAELPARWVSLQVGPRAAEAPRTIPERPRLADFYSTACVMASLDLVITIDTSVANLAGGLGVPCWLMAPTPCDFRWLASGERSPWFNSVRVFRQRSPGDWRSVVEAIRTSLTLKARLT